MAREAVIDSLAEYKGEVREEIKEKVSKIIALCEALRHYGKDFSFDKDEDLDNQVNRLLLALSDAIIEHIKERARKAVEEADYEDDEDKVWPYISREIGGQNLTERIDGYSSRLKYIIEGWLAIGFEKGFTESQLILDIVGFEGNPEAAPAWKEAMKEGGYAPAIFEEGTHFGQGVSASAVQGMTLTGQDAIMAGFTYGSLLKFERDGAIGYRIRRGSTFYCPFCDDHTYEVYPLTTVLLPLHPRCMCYPVPVYRKY